MSERVHLPVSVYFRTPPVNKWRGYYLTANSIALHVCMYAIHRQNGMPLKCESETINDW